MTKGEALSVNRIENIAETRKGVVERQSVMMYRYGHICMCELCVDPTEFGTYISAIVCKSCRGPNDRDKFVDENVGYLLPECYRITIDSTENVLWRCNTCRKVTPSNQIIPMINLLYGTLKHSIPSQSATRLRREV